MKALCTALPEFLERTSDTHPLKKILTKFWRDNRIAANHSNSAYQSAVFKKRGNKISPIERTQVGGKGIRYLSFSFKNPFSRYTYARRLSAPDRPYLAIKFDTDEYEENDSSANPTGKGEACYYYALKGDCLIEVSHF